MDEELSTIEPRLGLEEDSAAQVNGVGCYNTVSQLFALEIRSNRMTGVLSSPSQLKTGPVRAEVSRPRRRFT